MCHSEVGGVAEWAAVEIDSITLPPLLRLQEGLEADFPPQVEYLHADPSEEALDKIRKYLPSSLPLFPPLLSPLNDFA